MRERLLNHWLAGIITVAAAAYCHSEDLASLEQVLAAKSDLWGEAAMSASNGASYAFFEKLLPPPRYVNADFRYYPMVLSAPNAKVKARLISNGSGVNMRGGSRSWNDPGTPVLFRVGPDEFIIGGIIDRLEHPTLAEGYLPIPEIRYTHATEIYRLEAFAATDPALAENGIVFVQFSLSSGSNGIVTVEVGSETARFAAGAVTNESGTVVCFDKTWQWERRRAHAKIATNQFATLAIATKPMTDGMRFGDKGNALTGKSNVAHNLDYSLQRAHCVERWESILAEAMKVETPEPIVNNAWRNLIVQDFTLINGDRMNYSAGNQYEKMYAAESSDAAVPLMEWGYEDEMRTLLPVILDITDKRLPHHFAAHKLDSVCRFYWQTGDADFIKGLRPRWQKEIDVILTNRTGENGLMAKENYCTDIEIPVYSLNADTECWAALRDIRAVLQDIGDTAEASKVAEAATSLKQAILAAVDSNTRRETEPPFIPMALYYEEIHDPITETRLGSYWDLVANYVVGSRIFAGTERELWLPHYFEHHGGLCMGLTRSAAANHTFWTGKNRTNPLYGMRYITDCLRRDDVERALVSFYGMLAQGMTRNTFIGAEGCSIQPLDQGGRYFYCPPNSSSNGQWLSTLRHLLVQDLDLDEDGQPETLRLLFGTPKTWLKDGKTIRIERAPTAFGPVSITARSQLTRKTVKVELDLPQRNHPQRTLLRVRVPAGYSVSSAQVEAGTGVSASPPLKVDDRGTVDVSDLSGKVTIGFSVFAN